MKPIVDISMTCRSIICQCASILFLLSAAMSAQGNPETLEGVKDLPPYVQLTSGGSNNEAMWHYFMMVVELEKKESGAGRNLLKETAGIDEDNAFQVLSFIRSAIDDSMQADRDSHEATCSRKAAIVKRNSRTALASELRENESRGDTKRTLHVQSLAQVLQPENEAQLIDWVEKNLRPNMQMLVFDYDQYLNYEEIDVAEFVDRMCETNNVRVK